MFRCALSRDALSTTPNTCIFSEVSGTCHVVLKEPWAVMGNSRGGSCEFHRDCSRRTAICLLVPCLFFVPRGNVSRGFAAALHVESSVTQQIVQGR